MNIVWYCIDVLVSSKSQTSKGKDCSVSFFHWLVLISQQHDFIHFQPTPNKKAPRNICADKGCCRGWKCPEVSCNRRSCLTSWSQDSLSCRWHRMTQYFHVFNSHTQSVLMSNSNIATLEWKTLHRQALLCPVYNYSYGPMPSQETLRKIEGKWVVFVLHDAIPRFSTWTKTLCAL